MSAPATAAGLHITPVRGRRELKQFLRLPWKIYEGDPLWVPPLLHDVSTLLDRERHPFHQHAEVEYFLARRGGAVVGRIAAVVNRLHNEFSGDRTGFFGFFECIDDQAVANALFEGAESWLAERGMEMSRGPMNFSTNEECGLLLEGAAEPPFVMMTYNPPYYARLIEGAGYEKARDLLAYILYTEEKPSRLAKGVRRVAERKGISIRPLDMKRFEQEVALLEEIYNAAWERNWGFVPMTPAEFGFMAKQLKPVVDPNYTLIAEVNGEPVGFGLALPDFNQALKHINGRLLPFGLLKLLWHKRNIDQVRIITLGIKPGYRRLGLDAMMYLRMFEQAAQDAIKRGECSWILEDNWDMRRALEKMGGTEYKAYRIYDKPLSPK